MKIKSASRLAALTVLLTAGVAACSGNPASTPNAVPVAGTVPAAPSSAQATAHGTITFVVPAATRRLSKAEILRPSYISPSTTHAALYIGGGPAAAGSRACTAAATCTISWVYSGVVPSTPKFAVEIDDGSHVLAEGAAGSYAIHSGDNGQLAPLTLDGVAALASPAPITSETCSASTCNGTVTVEDSGANAIANLLVVPVPFENAPVTLASSATTVGSVSTTSLTNTSSTGSYAYTPTCLSPAGNFDVTASSTSAANPPVTSAELPAALTLPSLTATVRTYYCLVGKTISNHVPTVVAFTTPGSGTFTVPPGVTRLLAVEAIGSGASGSASSGGGGGGYAAAVNLTVSPGQILPTNVASSGSTTPSSVVNLSTEATYAVAGNGNGGAGGVGSIGTILGTGGVGGANAGTDGGGGGAAGSTGNGGAGGGGGPVLGGGGGGGAADNPSGSGNGSIGGAGGPGAGGTSIYGGAGGGGGTALFPLFTPGSAGAPGTESGAYGSGGGGGGGATSVATTTNGGAGGAYGGGGGGSSSAPKAGAGSSGAVIITY